MSSPNLPAGFSITTIDGKRCTAVPRSLTTLTGDLATAAVAQLPTTTTQVIASTTADAAPTTFATSVVQNTVPDTSPNVITTPTSTALAVPTLITTQNLSQSSIASVTSAIAASKSTTPTTSSSTPLAVAQSEVHASPTAATGENNGLDTSDTSVPSSTTSAPPILATSSEQPGESSASTGISSQPKFTAAPVVAGVVGSIALIAIVGLLFFFLRKRRKTRESLLTPLTTGRRSLFYEADNNSVGPSGRGNKWRTEFGYQTDRVQTVGSRIKAGVVAVGASLRSKVVGERSGTPNVNLNRGNSQFLDGPIPQHSRNNSIASNPAQSTIKSKATDFWKNLGCKIGFGWAKKSESRDPFAAARSMNEKRAMANGSPDFSQLLGMDDRDLQIQAERRRASLVGNTGSLAQLGSLGLNFNTAEDPFADPKKASVTPGWRPPNVKGNPFADPSTKTNPFADPVVKPDPTIPKSNTYIAAIRRSRGQSIDAGPTSNNKNPTSMYRPPSGAIESRYPSSLAPSHDSYRDTVASFATNARKGKGRSDPFDLERPELWRPRDSDLYPNPLVGTKGLAAGSAYNQNQRIFSAASYTSRYSSGASSLGDWGEPGPALGPSQNSSLRGNASSSGGSVDYTSGKPGLDDDRPVSRQISKASSKNGVGKAM
ncbi:hypothetical protein WAI453_006671 [Rhynchosporium graminicola]|uniref:Uncharacterized protein n=1 Tax=Rhynchosporium graminicola TaxID=2792576 RepID=A0A1E1K3B1_9HELO|nr:uncharacterized protein RCO7_01846 [Rhynchosporium commune]